MEKKITNMIKIKQKHTININYQKNILIENLNQAKITLNQIIFHQKHLITIN